MDSASPLPSTVEILSKNIPAMVVADYIVQSPSLRRSDPEVELQHQVPAHIPAPTDSNVSTAVNHNVTPHFIASKNELKPNLLGKRTLEHMST